MTRFLFHVHNDENYSDEERLELASCIDAQRKALCLAASVIADEAKTVKLGENWSMTVTSEDGSTSFQLKFFVAGAPAP